MGAFVEIGRAKITNTREAVISRRGDGMYSLAQVTEIVGDDQKKMSIFFKGAFTMDSKGLLRLKDLIDELFDENGNEKKK
jgi:hypothetical protein